MRTPRQISGLLAALIAMNAAAQTPYPELTIQDVAWAEGTHHYAVSNRILSPGIPDLPAVVTGGADAELVSSTTVRLAPGFHAGAFAGGGRFRARIDENLGPPGDVVVIAPHPGSSLVNHVVQVPKWEKFEIGLRLPEVYEAAIDSFFKHFYGNPNDLFVATPGSVQPARDLNPYADDSLQVWMVLTSPSGQQYMKWGFFMREARWATNAESAVLTAAPISHPHRKHNFRYRFAPNEEGDWTFKLSVRAPYSSTYANVSFPELHYTGHAFHCGPPLPHAHGYLRADTITRRLLRFDDGTAFFGLGINMADWRRNSLNYGTLFRYRDFREMRNSMALLHEEGGNFMRMYLMDKLLAPQQVNIGVFDAYRIPTICTLSESDDPSEPDCDRGWVSNSTFGNAQFQAWAFDSLLNTAHQEQLYIQLCIDPYSFPSSWGEKAGWGANPFVMNYLDPLPRPYDVRAFFYQDGDASNTTTGPFYYWKRKYKYILSRWGYSVNLAVIEPFNEIDQMLTYCSQNEAGDDLGSNAGIPACTQANIQTIPNRDSCRENRMYWPKNTLLPATVSQWFTDIANYVRGPVNFNDPVNSPLGEANRPFLASFAGGSEHTDQTFYLPFSNPKVDLLSVHQYMWPGVQDTGKADGWLNYAFKRSQDFRNNYPVANAPPALRKPFIQGEHCYSTEVEFGNTGGHEIEKYFHNYGVSFHNELWASAFSGKFATGMSWHWERVFWWTGALRPPPQDLLNNEWQLSQFSSVLDATNNIDIGLGFAIPIKNQRLHHHFKPLADLLSHESWTELGFFENAYTAHTVFDASQNNPNPIEAYYLKSTENTIAIGWVHNRKASVMNNFYLANTDTTQNFLGCRAPSDTSLTLTGFLPETSYHITWFPTWVNSTIHPVDTVWTTDNEGRLLLDLSTALFGDTITNFYFMDTLRADYAFIITPGPFEKSLVLDEDEPLIGKDWDYKLYPNPTRDVFYLHLPDDAPKDITILDLSGRQVQVLSKATGPTLSFPVAHLAKGVYHVRVTDGLNTKTKKLIIH